MHSVLAPSDEAALETALSRPTAAVMDTLAALEGDVLVLGAGGKMGPSLARMARRALDMIGVPRAGAGARQVHAAARFSDASLADALTADGIVPWRVDATDRAALARLPDAPNVLYLVGQKFGTQHDPVSTWAQNVVAPVLAAERFASSRVVMFSTGNVYPRTPVRDGGVRESHPLAPDGEYAASCIGRERVFAHAARTRGTRVLQYRLCYACDLRYGVVTDLATRVLANAPISLATGFANVIWQRDANALALRALALASPDAPALNISGPIVSVRAMAEQLAQRFGVTATFVDTEHEDALVVNTDALRAQLPPESGVDAPMPLETLIAWTADWVARGGRLLGKPTKFDVRSGTY
jgi:nucleoside-diphosphate-sugar epimerase